MDILVVDDDAGSPSAPHPVDLMITDLKMPGMNGLELIRAAREVRSNLPCILRTALKNPSRRMTSSSRSKS